MSEKNPSSGMPEAQALPLESLVEYGEGAVVSRTIAKGAAGTITVFAFDQGQELSEHSAPFDAYVTVLEGVGTFVIDGKQVRGEKGETVLMPANIPHAVLAPEPFKMLLVMLRNPKEGASNPVQV
jgi:quercetin dioxygenase-like cupin family protein